jgi:hypothetical protein
MMESKVGVNEAKDVEKPETESAPVHRFVRQTVESSDSVAVQDMPTEPGMYWASRNLVGEYDSILVIRGEPPFLSRYWLTLPVGIKGKKVDPRRTMQPVIGPAVRIPPLHP